MVDVESIWQEYGMEQLQSGLRELFPEAELSLSHVFGRVLQGDVLGALGEVLSGCSGGVSAWLGSLRSVLLWLVVLGILSALVTYFVEIFDSHQIADISFYMMYLLVMTLLLKCFGQAGDIAVDAMEQIVLFIRLLVPTYLLAVGAASGTATSGAAGELMMLLIYGVEKILVSGLVPLIYTYMMLVILNGVWTEEKLGLLIEFLEKGVGAALKAAVWIVTGIGIFQTLLSPVIDSVKSSALQKILTALPGLGDAAGGAAQLVMGSAVVIKNAIGVVLLLVLLALCLSPLLQIFCIACLLKLAAALMGIVGDRRMTAAVNRAGDGAAMLFRTAGTAMLLFFILISLVALGTNRGF